MPRTDEELRRRRDELEQIDVQQRAQLAAYGVDPARVRKIDLTFWAPDEAAASRLAEAMTRNEMAAPLVLAPVPGATNQRWVVRTSLQASVDSITTRENVVTFLLFADKYDCDFGGWGTAVVEVAERG